MLTLTDVKYQLRIPEDYTQEDPTLERLLLVAQVAVEGQLGRPVNWGNVNFSKLPGYKQQDGEPVAANAAIDHAVLLLVGHYWENREATAESQLSIVPLGVAALLNPYRILGVN